jgi:hypothetical protein
MPLKIIHPDHTEIMGRGLVLLSNSPTLRANRDLYTGQIVEEIALLSKSWAIIAKDTKKPDAVDESPSATSDLDKTVRDFVEEYEIKCVITMGGTEEPGITVKRQVDGSESEEILDIIKSGLEPHFTVKTGVDKSGSGSSVQSGGTRPDNSSTHAVHNLQLELGPEERTIQKDQIVNSFADIVGLINARLGFSESDERGSGVLD